MLQESFLRVYEKLKSEFCRQVFALVRERRGSLSAMEAFSLEVIRQLGRPTVSQFAAFLNISQSNAFIAFIAASFMPARLYSASSFSHVLMYFIFSL